MVWTGVTIAFYSGLMVPIIADTVKLDDEDMQMSLSMNAMIFFGIGEAIGGILIGYHIDH